MSSIGTLWTIPVQPQGKRIRAAAAFADIVLDLPEGYTHFQDNKKPEFTSKFPNGKIPAWEGKDGFLLTETTAIARYIASLAPNSTLLGSNPKETALIDQWISLGDSEINANTLLVRQLCTGALMPYAKPLHTAFLERQTRALRTLEGHLATRTFLVGERITLADISLAAVLQMACAVTFDDAARASCPHTMRFFETIVNHPKMKAIFGETSYTEKGMQYAPPPKEKKEAKPAPPPPPKTEKKPKKEEDDDEDDIVVREEPKAKNPLDSLPKSQFNLEDWKRAYSNMDTRGHGGSLEWFYKNFDPQGFSVWRVDFKYNSELTQVFMSSNQIGGFFNRLEASRKYLFGSMGVLGTAHNSVISGVLILRGLDVKPVVDVAPDWESYEYKRLDLHNAEDKKFFEAALAWDLEEGGKAWADGKNFK